MTQPTQLKDAYDYISERPSLDHPAYNCPADRIPELLKSLRDEHGYDMLSDLTAIDNGVEAHPRFTCVYHLFSMERHEYVRIAGDCKGSDERPRMPTVTHLWPAADWHEREAYDMFGIRFDGHPDLRRILMWDGYPYHPLRKDFPLAGIETDYPEAEIAEETDMKIISAPMMGGPFTAGHGHPMSESEPRGKDQSWTEKKPKPGSRG